MFYFTVLTDFIREKKGKIWRLNNWGLRKLAYKIKKAKNANYILMNFEIEAKNINEFKNMLDKDERIIRHLVIKRDEAITEDCPPPLEIHTLRANMDDDDDGDDYEQEEEEEGEEVEVINEGENVTDSDVFFVNEAEDSRDAGGRKARNKKPEKMLR